MFCLHCLLPFIAGLTVGLGLLSAGLFAVAADQRHEEEGFQRERE